MKKIVWIRAHPYSAFKNYLAYQKQPQRKKMKMMIRYLELAMQKGKTDIIEVIEY